MICQPTYIEANSAYQVLDSGDREKLEFFQGVLLIRPEPSALWPKQNPSLWKKAQAHFKNRQWFYKEGPLAPWTIHFDHFDMALDLDSLKQVGCFPEQQANWDWLAKTCKKSTRPLKILNLFGYTGGASLAAAQGNINEIIHIDALKSALATTQANIKLNGLENKRIRTIQEDVFRFVDRQVRTNKRYDGIILDPPSFGRGPKGQIWKLEDSLADLLSQLAKLLDQDSVFLILNTYTTGLSTATLDNLMQQVAWPKKQTITTSELIFKQAHSSLLLPAGTTCRWAYD